MKSFVRLTLLFLFVFSPETRADWFSDADCPAPVLSAIGNEKTRIEDFMPPLVGAHSAALEAAPFDAFFPESLDKGFITINGHLIKIQCFLGAPGEWNWEGAVASAREVFPKLLISAIQRIFEIDFVIKGNLFEIPATRADAFKTNTKNLKAIVIEACNPFRLNVAGWKIERDGFLSYHVCAEYPPARAYFTGEFNPTHQDGAETQALKRINSEITASLLQAASLQNGHFEPAQNSFLWKED